MGFPLPAVIYPAKKFIWSEDLLFSFLLSIIDRELFRFPLIFSFLLSSDLWSGIILFLFFFFLFISPFPLLSSGIQVLAFVIRSLLRRFCCPSLRGKGWGFSSQAKVQSSSRLCLNMVFSTCEPDFDIWGKTNSCVKVSASGRISILFPRGTRNNDDLGTCKISHGYS